MIRKLYRGAELTAWVTLWVLGACAGSSADCERVRDAVNHRLVACGIPSMLRLDCDSANYGNGDVDACVAAVKAAPCEDVESTYFAQCDGLFGRVGP
jgi:hypothetical protein